MAARTRRSLLARKISTVPTAFANEPLGGVLVADDIRKLAANGMISDYSEDGLQPASYDLALGHLYYADGCYRDFDEQPIESLTLRFGEFVLVTSLECLSLPDDVVAHAGLVSRRAQGGLISLFSPQIDPGFQGHIVVPLFNAGQRPITLVFGERMFTVEFVRTTKPTTRWIDGRRPLLDIPTSAMLLEGGLGALTRLGDEVDHLREDIAALRHEQTAGQRHEEALGETKRGVTWQRASVFAAFAVAGGAALDDPFLALLRDLFS